MFEKIKQFFNPCRICKKRKHFELKDGFVGCACTLGFMGVVKKNLTAERSEDVKEGAEFGFNKANEWHDLRKNPDDLPKHSGLYCVQSGEVREYVKEERSWFTIHFEPCMNRTEETYLWCEIPKFKE